MYAIIETGGKQYKVAPGDQLRVEKLPAEKGTEVEFDKVLLVNNDNDVIVDPAQLEKISVVGKVLEQGKGKKIIVFKSKRRKNYKRKQGHRQTFTGLKIEAIKGVN